MIEQTYLNGKHLVRCQFEWKNNRWHGIKARDCKCPVEYVKLDPKAMELYEVHFCDL
jgi:hypothetical protein